MYLNCKTLLVPNQRLISSKIKKEITILKETTCIEFDR
jgi:hypothetical protein